MTDFRAPLRATGELLQECGSLLAQLGRKTIEYAQHPSRLRSQMAVWKGQRQDRAQQARLNRQVRTQFIEAFNRSAKKDMTLDFHKKMRSYKFRNGLVSACLRPYEAFSTLSLPLKIASAVAFSKGVNYLLWPVVGIWGVVAPLSAFVVSRMALIYREAENKRQEEDLARQGVITPCTFEVKERTTSVMGRTIEDGLMIGFPVLHTPTPEWVTSTYNDSRKKLENRNTIHAAEFEACRSKTLPAEDIAGIRKTFAHDAHQTNCAFTLALLFPDETAEEIVARVQALNAETAMIPAEKAAGGLPAVFRRAAAPAASEGQYQAAPLPQAIVKAMEPFCLRNRESAGLSVFAGKIEMADVRFLVELHALGLGPTAAQAQEIVRMTKDPRFSTELPLQKIMEVAVWPKDRAVVFDDLWKDRECRARFGFDALKEITFNIESWGAVALNIARHEYARTLSGAEIIELALPENEYWAKTYHKLRLSLPETAQRVSHDNFKKAVQEFGLSAAAHLQPANKSSKRAKPANSNISKPLAAGNVKRA